LNNVNEPILDCIVQKMFLGRIFFLF